MSSPIWYNLLLNLIKPLYRWRIKAKSNHSIHYQQELCQRFGPFLPVVQQHSLWIHAVSVGETNAIQPVIDHYLQQGQSILLTNTTKTGQERAKKLFQHYGSRIQIVFLPIDDKRVVRQFLAHYRPKLLGLVETELWSNLLHEARKEHIPCLLLNARLSEKSAKAYARVPSLTKPMLQQLNHILAQDEATKQRFIQLGMPEQQITVVGNIKFDMAVPIEFQRKIQTLKRNPVLHQRKILLLASTHHDEEYQLLSQLKHHLQQDPQLLCIVVPRHPERFDDVMTICQTLNLHTQRRSLGQTIGADTQVYLADTMGELWLWYGISQSCFVGGSLNERGGGHNILEPILMEVPTIIGKKYFNFQSIVDTFYQKQAVQIAMTSQHAIELMLSHVQQITMSQQQVRRANQLLEQNKGSLQRHLKYIDGYLHLAEATL